MAFRSARVLRNLTAAIFAAASFLTIAPAFADKPTSVLDVAKPVKITVIPIDFDRDNPEHKNFGKLLWRGGLNLFANSPYFGGFSALAIDSSGKALLAVSDAGIWLRRDDRIRRTQAYVSFERHHRILRYPFSAQKFEPPTGSLQLPPGTKRMRPNSGLEAIALLGSGPLKGTVIAFSENLTDNNGNLQGWLVGGPTPGPFTLKLIEGLEVTDAAPLPDGRLILLERLSLQRGDKDADPPHQGERDQARRSDRGRDAARSQRRAHIDNMEGIAAHRTPTGETILTLISDDNYSPLQRTLLMQFAIPDEKPVLAEPAPVRRPGTVCPAPWRFPA